MSLEITIAVVGALTSALVAAFTTYFKDSSEKRSDKERELLAEDVKKRITEIGFSLAGITLSHKIGHQPEQPITLSDELISQIEEGIADRISSQGHVTDQQIKDEVEQAVADLTSRLESIENRFPDDSSIDKISSINDALFAERIEQLSDKIEQLESSRIDKWDIAIVVSMILAGIFSIVGITYAVLTAIGVIAR